MTFILRWPAVLVLMALVVVSLAAAVAGAIVLGQLPVDLASVLSPDQLATVGAVSWIEVGLWGGAGLFFFITAVRLIRRTQAFWTWLIGFALFGGRWAYAQQKGEGVLATVQGIDVHTFAQPQALADAPDAPAAQVALLAIVLIVGLLTLVIDAVDRAHWDNQSP